MSQEYHKNVGDPYSSLVEVGGSGVHIPRGCAYLHDTLSSSPGNDESKERICKKKKKKNYKVIKTLYMYQWLSFILSTLQTKSDTFENNVELDEMNNQ